MATAKEAQAQQDTPLNAALAAGLEMISYKGTIDFDRYVRVVMPVDGTVFWIKADLINPSAVPKAPDLPLMLTIEGSFHYGTDLSQDEAETFSTNRMVLTAIDEVVNFNSIDPQTLYVGVVPDSDPEVRFAFSSRGSFYRQADIFHYVGHAIYSVMATQLIDDPAQIDLDSLVVSNSLPIWLSMNNYAPLPVEYFGNAIPLYPSFLVPENLVPPYGSVHVIPDSTRALQASPRLDPTLGHTQLMAELVRITLYGVRNDDALTFVDFVEQFSVDTDLIGMMNVAAMRDEKRPQVEFTTLAQRKSITYEVSYYQSVARDIARQLILKVLTNWFIGSGPPQITSNGGGSTATIAVTHPATAVTTVVASSIAAVLFSIAGGANADLFRIHPSLGVLYFVTPSVPGSYVVEVQAGSLYGVATQTITVNVT